MPYIKSAQREMLHERVKQPSDPGELNYAVTKVLVDYWTRVGGGDYRAVNDVLGALEGAKLEFYRRVAAPYEDGKIQANGDVW